MNKKELEILESIQWRVKDLYRNKPKEEKELSDDVRHSLIWATAIAIIVLIICITIYCA